MSSLVIVESPAKCSKIQGFLGAGWRVIATMGHIRSLEEDLGAVGIERDFEPRYQFMKEKGKAIAQIKEAAAKATTIYLASDDDREGEAISYSVAVLLKLDIAATPRAVFHEITKKAVTAAVTNPRRIDMNRVNAQQARAVLDMMVGFTISPLLWKYVGPSLSAGRCQTPALRILVDRENEVQAFSTATAWKIKGQWSAPNIPFEASLSEQLEDRESAENYLENIHADSGGKIISASTRPTKEGAPKALSTSTLQQEASATFHMNPKSTMRIAQRLYEAGHITYMRTDSTEISEEAKVAATAWVKEHLGEEYLGESKRGKGQAEQQAHEAIRPTHIEIRELPPSEDWNAHDRKVYSLIWNRTIQSVMAPTRGEARTIQFVAVADPVEFPWTATWKRQTFAGWKRIGPAAVRLDAEEEEEEKEAAAEIWRVAAALDVGMDVRWSSLEAWPHDTAPPPRYTEATLVRELERRGIGRPSTFAALVGTVVDRAYAEISNIPPTEVKVPRIRVEKPGQWPPTNITESKKGGGEKNKLRPTALGRSVLEFCVREFQQLFAYEFTRNMEESLDNVAEGTCEWKKVCRDTWGAYKDTYEALKRGDSTVAAAPSKQRLFANGIKAVQSKKGPLLLKEGATKADTTVFYGWPEGKAFGEVTEADVAAFISSKTGGGGAASSELGTYNGKPIQKKSGPFGPYAECGGVNIPMKPEDTAETIQAKFAAKEQSILHKLGDFEFRNGPYGVFMFKTSVTGKARKFVSIPSGVDPKALTMEAAINIYQAGLKSKATANTYVKRKKEK